MNRVRQTLTGRLLGAAVLVLLFAGCASGGQVPRNGDGMAPGPADIRGYITRVNERQVLVEENPQETAGSPKAWVTIAATTRIVDAGGRALAMGELRKGQLVAVWFDGPAAESYPLQAKAGTIVVERTQAE